VFAGADCIEAGEGSIRDRERAAAESEASPAAVDVQRQCVMWSGFAAPGGVGQREEG